MLRLQHWKRSARPRGLVAREDLNPRVGREARRVELHAHFGEIPPDPFFSRGIRSACCSDRALDALCKRDAFTSAMETGVEAARAAFERFDKDSSGTIDAAELRHALEAAGLHVDGDQVAYMLRKYDDDRGATLDVDEFVDLVQGLRGTSVDAMQQRLSLRTHPDVETALDAWWSAVTRSSLSALSEARASGQPVQLGRDNYVVALRKVVKAMTEDYDEEVAEETAYDEWENDRKGFESLDEGLFKDGIFELADLRIPGFEAAEYSRFIWTLLGHVADRSLSEEYVWRADEQIVWGGYSDADLVARKYGRMGGIGEEDEDEDENESDDEGRKASQSAEAARRDERARREAREAEKAAKEEAARLAAEEKARLAAEAKAAQEEMKRAAREKAEAEAAAKAEALRRAKEESAAAKEAAAAARAAKEAEEKAATKAAAEAAKRAAKEEEERAAALRAEAMRKAKEESEARRLENERLAREKADAARREAHSALEAAMAESLADSEATSERLAEEKRVREMEALWKPAASGAEGDRRRELLRLEMETAEADRKRREEELAKEEAKRKAAEEKKRADEARWRPAASDAFRHKELLRLEAQSAEADRIRRLEEQARDEAKCKAAEQRQREHKKLQRRHRWTVEKAFDEAARWDRETDTQPAWMKPNAVPSVIKDGASQVGSCCTRSMSLTVPSVRAASAARSARCGDTTESSPSLSLSAPACLCGILGGPC